MAVRTQGLLSRTAGATLCARASKAKNQCFFLDIMSTSLQYGGARGRLGELGVPRSVGASVRRASADTGALCFRFSIYPTIVSLL